MKNYTLLCLFTFITFVACKNDANNNTAKTPVSNVAANLDYNQVAPEFCKCMMPLVDLNKEIQNLINEGKQEKLAALFTEVEKSSEASETCVEKMETIYGTFTPEIEQKIRRAMKNNCPEVVAMLEEADKLNEK